MPGLNSGASGFCLRVPRISLHSRKEKQQRRQLYVSLQRNASTEMNKMRLVFWDCHRRDSFPVHPVGTSLSASASASASSPRIQLSHRLTDWVGVARSALRSLRKATRNDIQIEQGVFFKAYFFLEAIQLLWRAASPGLSVRGDCGAVTVWLLNPERFFFFF